MKDWKAAVRTWEKNGYSKPKETGYRQEMSAEEKAIWGITDQPTMSAEEKAIWGIS